MTMPDTTIYLKNYQPPSFTVETVELNFDLYDDHALVNSTLKLTRQNDGALHLYGEELELIALHLNGRPLEHEKYVLTKDALIIEQCPDEIVLNIVTRIKPQENTQLSGLYRSNHLFCTQCEAEGFRRITYYLDRPDVLATFTTRITADKKQYPILLSNGNLMDTGETADGRHWVIWEDPFKKPSYLFALVAGNLACVRDSFVTCSGRIVDLRIYVEPGNEDKCSHAMESLKKAMKWDEEVYGREYDLDIYMIVAVSDFNMGAMENKGLNIFNSKYILARPETATDQDFADVEGVVGHEYFHNWTGNRVTCRDWFQLSLKEGLTVFRDQEFSRDMNSRDVNRIMDVKVLRSAQFPEDAGSMAHPVRPESYQEINNFYTATVYNKGAEVIRMQHTLLGKERFRRGMDLYFKRHDGYAVTIDDFVAAMEDANGVDLTQFKLWYSQAGTPEVRVLSHFSEGRLEITMQQNCPPTPECHEKKPFHIPVRIALFDLKGEMIPIENELLELKEKEQRFIFSGLNEKPVVSLLREFSAPVKIYDDLDQDDLLFLLRYETDGYAKWDAAQRLVLNCLNENLKLPASEWQVSKTLVAAFQHVLLDDSLDMDLRAELLTPPGFEEVAATMKWVDVSKVESVRDYFRQQLGLGLYTEASDLYKELWEVEDHRMHGQAYGRRKLRNVCLWLMMKANESDALELCREQFKASRTMTDQIASCSLLVNCSRESQRNEAIEGFYKQWSHNELVLDKWFAMQAACELPGTLDHVKKLTQHPAFCIKNPNKVRALVGAFCMANPRNFHALDGSGYVFLSEVLIKLDKLNPQIAARLATPFTRWRSYDEPRQKLIQNQLEQLTKLDLSRDLREVVDKSLIVEEK
ncbi:TPA: aminopeptidase N [Legionella pneumophila]|uniref:Aminopeptidase N n=3 Tax=Legionella pneumophila TaxID=446 RepID=Q5ZRS1_LEGPH|nr:aminopeptidase N [Legionella pneumophila subsp. pneumophila str. Philadelphia 1]AEW53032.1 aminopeptidase N [Legionella pneumophila subsp. pneumophila ATCC 43290]AGN15719.1 aminopeptidase N [Legionella pneumophila subsp. pneumophila str. Thunder Bay]OOK38809.1 aminopeptidase N [Legionella pneumophila subsp. pneumophila str. Sudbury]PNL76853.1 aminopeptidase N [Legionella pneumophila subsp. pneumophila]PPK30891.1 aminopeptidase N [Legionella pneumophila]